MPFKLSTNIPTANGKEMIEPILLLLASAFPGLYCDASSKFFEIYSMREQLFNKEFLKKLLSSTAYSFATFDDLTFIQTIPNTAISVNIIVDNKITALIADFPHPLLKDFDKKFS